MFAYLFLLHPLLTLPIPILSSLLFLPRLSLYFALPPPRFWTESYAMPRGEVAGNEAHPAVRRLVEMGFAEEDCRQALLTHKGNAFIFLISRKFYLCIHFEQRRSMFVYICILLYFVLNYFF